jgi:hypothetical protein
VPLAAWQHVFSLSHLFTQPSSSMQSEAPNPSSNNEPPQGLPPVAPPSGRFIAQLFLVPGLIVTVAVFIYLGSSYLVQSSQTPKNFLDNLDSRNPEVRWRGAHDLAQVLKRPESLALASDPKFALDLAERLDRAVAEVEKAEQATAEEIAKAEKAAKEQGHQLTEEKRNAYWLKLADQRHLVLYLTACMGDFTIPVGAPVLGAIAVKDQGPEIKGLTARRRRAVLALANLGNNFKRRYLGENPGPEDKVLSAEQKDAIIAQLKEEAKGKGKRAAWARQALASLEKDSGPPSPGAGRTHLIAQVIAAQGLVSLGAASPGVPQVAVALGVAAFDAFPLSPGVDAVLARCAAADDPFLREQVALALYFWDGPLVEPTLLRLTRDDGHGQKFEITEAD